MTNKCSFTSACWQVLEILDATKCDRRMIIEGDKRIFTANGKTVATYVYGKGLTIYKAINKYAKAGKEN